MLSGTKRQVLKELLFAEAAYVERRSEMEIAKDVYEQTLIDLAAADQKMAAARNNVEMEFDIQL